MKRINCDVLVVGSGPAGSSAARAASLMGAKTILIDKKEEIGMNVPCAEGIGQDFIEKLPFKIPEKQLIWRIEGMIYYCLDLSVEHNMDPWKGYSIDRKYFDRWLAELAVEKGAKLMTSAELIDLEFDETNNVKKALIKIKDKYMEILPKVLVGADGCESTVLKLMGLFKPKEGDIPQIYCYELGNLKIEKSHFQQLYFGPWAPTGWGYIFPKSDSVANVGIGLIFPKDKKEPQRKFEEFLELEPLRKMTKNAEILVDKRSTIRHGNVVDKWIYNNVIFAGDSVNHNIKPYYEGILPCIICGDIAGKLSVRMCKNELITHETYLKEVKNKLSPYFEISQKLIELMLKIVKMKDERKYAIMPNAMIMITAMEKYKKTQLEKLYDLLFMDLDELLEFMTSKRNIENII